MLVVGLTFIVLENMLQHAISDTYLISWNINGNGPLTYINLKFNMDSISDTPEQDNNQVKYNHVNQNYIYMYVLLCILSKSLQHMLNIAVPASARQR